MSSSSHDVRLAELLDVALAHPLTLITGGSGWGKSSLLTRWAELDDVLPVRRTGLDPTPLAFGRRLLETVALRHPAIQLPAVLDTSSVRGPDLDAVASDLAELVASAVRGAMGEDLPQPLLLLIDDLDDLPAGVPETILALARQAPTNLHLAVATRSVGDLRVARVRAENRLGEITPVELAFTVDELSDELRERVGAEAGEHAARLHRLTNGWPLAVALVVTSLQRTEPTRWRRRIDSLDQPGSPLVDLLIEEGLEQLDPMSLDVLLVAEQVPRLNQRFCEAVGVGPMPPDLLGRLSEAGLFLTADPDEHGWYRSTRLAGSVLGALIPPTDRSTLVDPKRLADAYVAGGRVEEALRVWAEHLPISTDDDLRHFVVDHADRLIERADPESMQRVLDRLGTLDDPIVSETIGQLSFRRGDWDRAVEAFEHCEQLRGSLPARLGSRLAQIRYLRGEIGPAIAVCERAVLGQGDRAADAQLLAWWSSALWLRNDVDACADRAEQAFVAATESRDDEALATAHTVLAMLAALRSDRSANDLHYLRALDHAKRAGDVMQIMRIRSNRGSRFIEEGLYAEALVELDQAIELGETSGFGSMLTIGLVNRGEAFHAMGRLDDALRDLRTALEVATRIGSLEAAYALLDIGLVQIDRGEIRQARASLREALGMAEPEGDLQAMVPALVGLARVALIDRDTETGGVALARSLIDRALVGEASLDHPHALAVSAMVALAEGDRTRAAGDATRAADIAAKRRDRPGLALAYEMQALAADPPDPVAADRALAIWDEIGNTVGTCRAMLVKARAVPEQGSALTRSAQLRAERIGARGLAADAEALHRELARSVRHGLEIRTLGSFSVTRDGVDIGLASWQSKKARDLCKMLLARRPHRMPRDQMIELLWPDEPFEKSQRRFSVALSTVRSVLDPEKRKPSDHYIVADHTTVGLRVENLQLDVADFLELTDEAERLLRGGDPVLARQELERAGSLYRGPFLEDDLYEDWSIAMREQCRLRFVDLSRNLALLYQHDGDLDRAASQWLRILESDPFDEEAHLAVITLLTSRRRHGEARRAYRRYAARMAEIGVEATAFPPV